MSPVNDIIQLFYLQRCDSAILAASSSFPTLLLTAPLPLLPPNCVIRTPNQSYHETLKYNIIFLDKQWLHLNTHANTHTQTNK